MTLKIRWERVWMVFKWPLFIFLGIVAATLLLILAGGFIYGNNLTGEE